MYYVYLIKSKFRDQFYTGSTKDLKKRLCDHNNGEVTSTKRYRPWQLVYYEAYASENLARLREKKLKCHGNAIKELKKRVGLNLENSAKRVYPAPLLKSKSGAGFTLLEVIIAIFILTVGIGGAFALITRVAQTSSLPNSRLAASYLAQEGIEIVRNIRDANFLSISNGIEVDWDEGLTGCGGAVGPTGCDSGCEADYNDSNLQSFGDNFLKIDTNVYTYDPGVDTPFKRSIDINISGDEMKVEVEVCWEEKGKQQSVTAASEMYDWLLP